MIYIRYFEAIHLHTRDLLLSIELLTSVSISFSSSNVFTGSFLSTGLLVGAWAWGELGGLARDVVVAFMSRRQFTSRTWKECFVQLLVVSVHRGDEPVKERTWNKYISFSYSAVLRYTFNIYRVSQQFRIRGKVCWLKNLAFVYQRYKLCFQ